MDAGSLYRLYASDELSPDGYPAAWHQTLKHDVRERAGHRCVRCGHPYRTGENGNGEWSPCDTGCAHRGPIRVAGIGAVEDSPPRLWLRDGLDVDALWRILTVHHLDGNKANCRWWNLAALCQRCHLEIQGRVHIAQVYPYEHTPWFRPYAAGYYALAYLGEDLTRDQVEARLAELLALELATHTQPSNQEGIILRP